MAKKKAWGGRFDGETDRFVEEFTASIPYDVLLYRHDIAGASAHARSWEAVILPRRSGGIVRACGDPRGDRVGEIPFDLSD